MIKAKQNIWWRLELQFPCELEETLIWKFTTLGMNRFAIKCSPDEKLNSLLLLWLPSNEWSLEDRQQLINSLHPLAETFGKEISIAKWKSIKDEDWSSSWKKHWKPDPIGEKLLILPAWLQVPEEYSNRLVLRLDPGSAFGTGSHPTTRLCLEALERNPPLGLTIADIGCGSGILSLGALAFGAKQALGVDIDSLAISSIHANAALNNWDQESLKASIGSLQVLEKDLMQGPVDMILCNILAPVIKSLAPGFSKLTSTNGQLVLSGLLASQIDEVTTCMCSLGWRLVDSYCLENWALLHLRKSP